MVVVTGGSGFIGSILVPLIVQAGFKVRVIDRFFFGDTIPNNPYIEKVKIDSRDIQTDLIESAFAVIDLAALSNDPAGEIDPLKTLDINYRARRRLQEISADLSVDRYILASSCSVYGFQEGLLDETSGTNPLTTYAEANLLAEQSALDLHRKGTDMAVILFRQATMYGVSPRMRFDIAINGMTLGLWQNGTLPILRDGLQWRPMIHVQDTSKAFILALSAEKKFLAGECFNVGSNDQNFQIIKLAELVAEGIGKECKISWYGEPDHRSYQVNFSKIKKTLGFTTDWTPDRGAAEIIKALESGAIKPDLQTKTLAWYNELITWQKRLLELAPNGRLL